MWRAFFRWEILCWFLDWWSQLWDDLYISNKFQKIWKLAQTLQRKELKYLQRSLKDARYSVKEKGRSWSECYQRINLAKGGHIFCKILAKARLTLKKILHRWALPSLQLFHFIYTHSTKQKVWNTTEKRGKGLEGCQRQSSTVQIDKTG